MSSLSALSASSGSGSLAPYFSTEIQGGYVAAGTAMRNLGGHGEINVAGIPQGSTVQRAFLMWDILDNSPEPSLAQGVFGATPITGQMLGSGASPCWPSSGSYSYVADVTPMVPGNGDYLLSGFASGVATGEDPWSSPAANPEAEGASLFVVSANPQSATTTVLLYGGDAEASGGTLTQTLSGFTAASSPNVTTTFIVADGQSAPDGPTMFNATVLNSQFQGADPLPAHQGSYSQGNLWDTKTVDVSTAVNAGDTSATVAISTGSDCLVWVGQALAVTTQTAVLPHPVLYVHGIAENSARDIDFKPLFDRLVATIPGLHLENFAYYQDIGCSTGSGTPPAIPAADSSMPIDVASEGGSCDSEPDLGLNTVKLEEKVRALHDLTHQTVILVGYSMGASTIRGMLAYS